MDMDPFKGTLQNSETLSPKPFSPDIARRELQLRGLDTDTSPDKFLAATRQGWFRVDRV